MSERKMSRSDNENVNTSGMNNTAMRGASATTSAPSSTLSSFYVMTVGQIESCKVC
jgi:hypothetical protein